MSQARKSESITENIFRNFYGSTTFIEKSAIPESYGFKTKKNLKKNKAEEELSNKGFPDFFKAIDDFLIIVECKDTTDKHSQAEEETKYYMSNVYDKHNSIGIAISGQSTEELKVSMFLQLKGIKKPVDLNLKSLLSLDDLKRLYIERSAKENYEHLISYADTLNSIFHNQWNDPLNVDTF